MHSNFIKSCSQNEKCSWPLTGRFYNLLYIVDIGGGAKESMSKKKKKDQEKGDGQHAHEGQESCESQQSHSKIPKKTK